MDLEINDLQWLMCHLTKPILSKTKQNMISFGLVWFLFSIFFIQDSSSIKRKKSQQSSSLRVKKLLLFFFQ